MNLDNNNTRKFPIEFSGDNTFISRPNENLEDVIDRFPDIDSKDKTVIVTDPYLFSTQDSDYEKNVLKALKKLEASKIIYCHINNPNRNFFARVKNALGNCALEYVNMDSLHDRHWFCVESKKGFYTGTSLNGVGKKYCTVDPLSEETCNDFYNIITEKGIIENE